MVKVIAYYSICFLKFWKVRIIRSQTKQRMKFLSLARSPLMHKEVKDVSKKLIVIYVSNNTLHSVSHQASEIHSEAVVRRSSVKWVNKIRKIHRKTSVLQPLFNKVAGVQACNFIKKRLKHRCFSVYFSNF